MVEVKLKITWKEYLFSLIKSFEGVIIKLFSQIKRFSKQMFKWSIMQILFLVQFEYSQDNIKQYFLNKAAYFFGFDLNEGRLKKKKKGKSVRTKYCFNNKGDDTQKLSKSQKRKVRDKKNKKKNVKNIYNPHVSTTI